MMRLNEVQLLRELQRGDDASRHLLSALASMKCSSQRNCNLQPDGTWRRVVSPQ